MTVDRRTRERGRQRGASLIETSLILLLIAALAFLAVATFGSSVTGLFNEGGSGFNTEQSVTTTAPGGGGGGGGGGPSNRDTNGTNGQQDCQDILIPPEADHCVDGVWYDSDGNPIGP